MVTELSRRDFLRGSLGGLAFLAGCAAPSQNITKPEEFNIKAFTRWYRANKLYNGANPNLRRPHSPTSYSLGGLVAPLFKDTLQKQVTPGLTYDVPAGEIMVAVAPGVLAEIGEITGTGRAGGMYVIIVHHYGDYPTYISNFSHVTGPIVKVGAHVKRGESICSVPIEHCQYAKLIVREVGNYVDPDNYGINHQYMDYYTTPLDMDKEIISNPKKILDKFINQQNVLFKLNKFRTGWEQDSVLSDLWHNKGGYKPSEWSIVEKFRFLSTMYEMYPAVFPDLKKEEFETMKKEFYANQPIILTLPFKKGGLR